MTDVDSAVAAPFRVGSDAYQRVMCIVTSAARSVGVLVADENVEGASALNENPESNTQRQAGHLPTVALCVLKRNTQAAMAARCRSSATSAARRTASTSALGRPNRSRACRASSGEEKPLGKVDGRTREGPERALESLIQFGACLLVEHVSELAVQAPSEIGVLRLAMAIFLKALRMAGSFAVIA